MRGLRIDERIVDELEQALEAARMRRAGFHLAGHLPGRRYWEDADADTAAIKEATRLYRQSWIIGPLQRAIERIRGVRVCAVCGREVPDDQLFDNIQGITGFGRCPECAMAKAVVL